MGIFTRFRDIVSSNINAMLEKAEDPQKLIKLMIQEMEDTQVEIKASCAEAMANRAKVQRAAKSAAEHALDWEAKAELAMNKGREDLAREAIVRKRGYEQQAQDLDAQADELAGVVEKYHTDIEQLEEKLAGARQKHRVLVQRHKQASRRKKAQLKIRRADATDAMVRFEQFENRIERMEAEAELVNHGRRPSLESEIDQLAQDGDVEADLEALRKKMSGKKQTKTKS